MCTRNECIRRIAEAAPHIKEEYGVSSLCLFGSMARGDNHPDSDVDVCVEMPPNFFKVLGLKRFIEELVGTSVDLVRRNRNLSQFFLANIERDAVYII